MKIVKNSNERYRPTYTVIEGISITEPEHGLSVRTIMAKFAQGISVPQYNGIYSEDMPDLRFHDLEEIEEWKRNQKEHIKDLEERKKNALMEYNTYKREKTEKQLNKIENE